jgi:hypothetical protein
LLFLPLVTCLWHEVAELLLDTQDYFLATV